MTRREMTDWDPHDSSVLVDQRAAYDMMRQQCPVARSDSMNWSLFRHADIQAVLEDPETYMNSSRHHAIPNAMNGLEHERHRVFLAQFFTPERMNAIEPRCRAIAHECLAAGLASNALDAMADFAEPLAYRTICAFLGWDDDFWVRIRDWIDGNRDATFRRDREAAHRMADAYASLVIDILEEHRNRGTTHDIMADMMDTEIDGQRWTDEHILQTLRNWIAGQGTVAAAIGIMIVHLARDPEIQHELRNHPELVSIAIDEIPRVDGPLVSNKRTTSRKVTIRGREIDAGERLSLMWIAANRDPHAFVKPDRVCLSRDQRTNLLYGAGIHLCIGKPLAQLQLRVAIETLLESTTCIRIPDGAIMQREVNPGNGFISVPLAIEAR